MFRLPAFHQVKEFADYISTSNAILLLRPYRKTAKSLSNEMTREIRSMRRRRCDDEGEVLVGEAFADCPCGFKVCAGRLGCDTVSQSIPKAFGCIEMKWWIRRQVSTRTWSLVTNGSSVASSCFARPFCRSLRSAAAYQAELSTKILMTPLNGGVFRRPSLPRSFDLSPKRYQMFPTYQDRRRWNGQYFVGTRPSPDQPDVFGK